MVGQIEMASMENSYAIRHYFTQAVAKFIDDATAARLYELFNQIALLHYEASESVGTLLLTSPNRSCVELALGLTSPLDVADPRGVRKLLQISSASLSVLCDGTQIYGFGRQLRTTKWLPLVEFQHYGRWRLSQREDDWLEVDVSTPPQPNSSLSASIFKDCVQKIFGPISPASAEQLWQLMEAASHQPRGTTVLITPYAAAEVSRLSTQCTLVTPTSLTPQMIKRITAIDGTVIIDLNGVCHAVGAILDGTVSERGDRTRGGRYNSALMYVDSCAAPCMIVTVSQDGPVDYLFRPDRIRHV
jgi:hypothetical protein